MDIETLRQSLSPITPLINKETNEKRIYDKVKESLEIDIEAYKRFLFFSTQKEMNYINNLRNIISWILIVAFVISLFIMLLMMFNCIKISNELMIGFITSYFMQLFALVVIVIKYAFSPIEIMFKHVNEMILDQRNKSE